MTLTLLTPRTCRFTNPMSKAEPRHIVNLDQRQYEYHPLCLVNEQSPKVLGQLHR